MSEKSDDASVKTATATGNNNTEQQDSSSPYLMVSVSTRPLSDASSPKSGVAAKEKDLISPRKEKLSSESKKQAVAKICSSNDPLKRVTESTVTDVISDNANNRKPSKKLKTNTKSTETKKMQGTRPSDQCRRSSGVFYAGHGRRETIHCGLHSITYTSRDYWRPHSASSHNGSSSRRLVPSTIYDQTHETNDIAGATRTAAITDNAGNANQRASTTESPENIRSHANTLSHRSQVTRIFHNGALRANRTWRGNVAARSGSHTVVSEHISQRLAEHATTNNDDTPHGSNGADIASHIRNRGMLNQRKGKLPIIYVAPAGTISILLDKGVAIEVAVDRSIRVLCHDKFSAVCNGRGSNSCILHKKARIFQQDEKVFCNFGSSVLTNEKAAVFGTHGILFTMSHLSEAYLVSSTVVKGTLSISLGRLQFPSLDYDFTVRMFFTESQNGDQFTELCNAIVQEARYGTRDDGTLTLTINGVYIKQDERGDIEVNCRPKHIRCSPSDGVIHVRTNMVDMAVQQDDKAYVKRGLKRVHVSRSGMVVSDGNCITSMDHFGNIVSST